MRRVKTLFGLVLILVLSACNISVSTVSTGALQSYRVNVPHPAETSQPIEVRFDIGSASTIVSVGGSGLLDGTVETNVIDWKPQVIANNSHVLVRQAEFSGIPPLNAQNDWHIRIGQRIPMSLTVNAGAIKGEWEIGGLTLKSLDWKQGAADTTLRFSSLNQSLMNHLSVDAGASTLRLMGLANTGTNILRVNIGAGTLNLQFDGALTRNMTVTVDGGAAAVTIDSGGNQVQVLTGQSLSAVTRGDWQQDADTYQSPEWVSGPQPRITVHTNLAASSLNLVNGR